MRSKVIIGAVCAVLSTVNFAVAEVLTVGDFVQAAETNVGYRRVIEGAGRGMEGVNLHLYAVKQPELYCPPEKMAFTGDQYVEILANRARRSPALASMPAGLIGYAMLGALIQTFPCP
ncbi:hypothetical protein [Mycoplana dimorpha]|uniref:Rap1a immunity protein domain-containing protein n=1 Tax=Mycoplana dimorpha TaxID=28320 RepID=A0A2T5BAV7_MYCDI|nr:hypothetical protein [Mycoplana dimorpha]PTM96120.1 hypothetical protein C7449_103134 [Mycoplana dimorpha]